MSEALTIYLHDHLGAANFAIELVKTWRRDSPAGEFRTFATTLLQAITRDRATLRQIVRKIGAHRDKPKELAGWIAEKASRFKLAHEADQHLARFEGLEILSLGILGKVALWKVLGQVSRRDARLRDFDFAALARQARLQFTAVEGRRLRTARAVFVPPGR